MSPPVGLVEWLEVGGRDRLARARVNKVVSYEPRWRDAVRLVCDREMPGVRVA